MADVPLFDVLSPYFFAGIDLGPGVHRLLGLLHLDEIASSWDDDAVVLSGVARIDSDDPDSFVFSPMAGGGATNIDPASNGYDDDGPGAWEWHDVAVRFRLTVARRHTDVLPTSGVASTTLRSLLEGFGPATGAGGSDYPGTQFRLELLLDLVTLVMPGFRGAKLEGSILVPDEDKPDVRMKLPRILLVVEQGSSGPDTPFDVRVGSFGATGLDNQSRSIGTYVEMDPPYALFRYGGWGIGVRSVVVDLDDSQTPPELREQFGIGDDWQGLYLPEARLFVQPEGLTGLAVSAGVRDFLWGIRATPGIWGDALVDVVSQGDALKVEVRFHDAQRNRILPGIAYDLTDDDMTLTVAVPDETSMIVDVVSGAAPYSIKGLFGRDRRSAPPDDSEFDGPGAIALDVSQHHNISGVEQQIVLRITSRNPSQTRRVVIEVSPRAADTTAPAGPTYGEVDISPPPSPPPANGGWVTLAPGTDDVSAMLRIEPAAHAALVIGPPGDTRSIPVVDGRARVPVATGGDAVPFTVTWTEPTPRVPDRVHCFFDEDRPRNLTEATDTGAAPQPPPGQPFADSEALERFLTQAPAGTVIRIDGFASFEASTNPEHDARLSQRRADYLKRILDDAIAARGLSLTVGAVEGFGHDRHPLTTATDAELQAQLEDPDANLNRPARAVATELGQEAALRSLFWRATASYTRDKITPPVTLDGTLTRPAPIPPPARVPPDVPPPQAQRPDWFREIGLTVRVLQSKPVALEIRGKVDFHTAAETGLEEFRGTAQPGVENPPTIPPLPERTNPEDGVVSFRLNLSHDDTSDTWTERLMLAASEQDHDGLWRLGTIPTGDGAEPPAGSLHLGRDLLGLYFALAPLLASSARGAADDGDVVPLAVELGIPLALAPLNLARVEQFTVYGGEVVVKHHGAFDDGKVAVLLDAESALWLDLRIGSLRLVTSRPDKPVRVRYKAVGFTANAGFDGSGPFVPVFDASKGYTLDLADSGSLRVLPDAPGPLGDIIQIVGARVARTNPLNLEVELGIGVDLGVFTVDKLGFRLPIDPLGAPTLTSLGVAVDVPGTVSGRGELTLGNGGMAGQVDVSLPSVGLRIAATLAIQAIQQGARTGTGVMLAMRAEFPVAIPLAGSGLGIFGFLGLFAMHYRRNEPATGNDRALRWLRDVVHGNPTDLAGWVPQLDAWSFGAGAVLGTMEGAHVVRMSGLVAIELPGPRLLFFLKADLLNTEPRGKVEEESGALLCVLDIDVAAHTINVGIQLDYALKPVLQLTAPVEGFFDTQTPRNFAVDVGSITRPITATVFDTFKATAYLMVHGNGITGLPGGDLHGFSVAAGFHLSLVWGDTDIGLYLEVAAGFDAGIGFAPFFISGRIYLSGDLHLFVVSIEARGELEARSDGTDTWVHGEVCGSVDCWFFEVEGCVSFALGSQPGAPAAPALVRALALQSRSPALVRGSGIERGIDTVLCRGTTDGSVPVETDPDGDARPVHVPIDAIPLIQLEVAPELASDFTIDGPLRGGLPGGTAGWRKRGDVWVRYRLRAVRLTSPGHGTVVTAGDRPNTWRTISQATGGDAAPLDLALLDWSPDATPNAFEAGPARDQAVEDRWGEVCTPAAPPAPVMWTFQQSAEGTSPAGWRLVGEAWPDPPDTRRSTPVDLRLTVVETWRTGSLFDSLLDVVPATVLTAMVTCPEGAAVGPSAPTTPGRRAVLDSATLPRHVPAVIAPTAPIAPASADREARDGLVASLAPAPAAAAKAATLRELPALLAAASSSQRCPSRILLAPFERLGAGRAPDDLEKLLAEYLGERGKGFADVVRFEGGPFASFRALGVFHSKVRAQNLYRARAYGGDGQPIGVDLAFTPVTTAADLPPSWIDAAGPWLREVMLGTQALARIGGLELMLVHFKLSGTAAVIELGLEPLSEALLKHTLAYPAFALAAMEGLSAAEIGRADADASSAAGDLEGILGALVHDPAQRALLLPGRRYDVAVEYRAEVGKKKERPEEADPDGDGFVVVRAEDSFTQTFTFHTDAAPPARLEPWVLCQFPSPGERHHFHDEPVVVVFGSDDLTQLFAAYGRDLRAAVRDASFRPPAGTPERERTRWVLDASVLQKLTGVVLSPFEQTARRLLGGKACGDFNPASPRHERATLPLELEPSSEYVFDIEAPRKSDGVVPAPPAGQVIQPLYRRGFATSRYASREALAADVRQTRVQSRRLPTPAPLAALADACTDQAFDGALAAAGLGAAAPVTEPRVTILWQDATPPRPYAVLVETPEPLWRTRLEPEATRDADGRVIAWELVPRIWLSVDELVPTAAPPAGWHDIRTLPFVRRATGTRLVSARSLVALRDLYLQPVVPPPPPPAPPSLSQVQRLVHDASGCRTLALLKTTARGKTVSLGLGRALHPLIDADASDDPLSILDVFLERAPWEESV